MNNVLFNNRVMGNGIAAADHEYIDIDLRNFLMYLPKKKYATGIVFVVIR